MRNKPINPMLLTDGYKFGHRVQYEKGTEKVYTTWTPRGSRVKGTDSAILFGLQMFVKKWLIDYFNENFFSANVDEICEDYTRLRKAYLGESEVDVSHIRELHSIGYLPLKIMAVPEGMDTPIRVPQITIESTDSRAFWLVQYIETLFSTEMWYMSVVADVSRRYNNTITKYHMLTCDTLDSVQFSSHNFSYRGNHSNDAAIYNGMAHLLFSVGTDTVPAIVNLEKYYNANIEKELVGCSVNASEHAVIEGGLEEFEFETVKRLITEVYPNGIFSLISDTWDFWGMVTDKLPRLKNEIMNREGRLVIRPDSGIPKDIICGNPSSEIEHERKGAIEVLWDTFGGTINSKGYKVLDTHVRLIQGEAVQPNVLSDILETLMDKGFASENVLFGVGSYGFLSAGEEGGCATRDTLGYAIKVSYVVVNGEERMTFKNPKTDDGLKQSQKGLVAVVRKEDGEIGYVDNLLKDELDLINERGLNIMRPIFQDGKLLVDDSLAEIRKRVRE